MFRPVIEFFTDGFPQVQPRFGAGFHVHEAVARARTASPREVETEEAEGILLEVHQPGFRFVQCQSLGGHILFQSLQHRAAAAGAAQQHEVVGVADELRVQLRVIVHPVIQAVEIQIGQQRRQDSALRRAPVVRMVTPLAVLFLYDGGFEEELHQSEDTAVTHAPGHQPEQPCMVDGVEVAA